MIGPYPGNEGWYIQGAGSVVPSANCALAYQKFYDTREFGSLPDRHIHAT